MVSERSLPYRTHTVIYFVREIYFKILCALSRNPGRFPNILKTNTEGALFDDLVSSISSCVFFNFVGRFWDVPVAVPLRLNNSCVHNFRNMPTTFT